MNILVVDDDRNFRELIIRILIMAGYETHTAENGRTGVEKAKEVCPDLILMDVDMPVMSGYEAVSVLRHGGYNGAIATCTSSIEHSKIIDAGFNHIITKPFIIDDFLELIKQIITVSQGWFSGDKSQDG